MLARVLLIITGYLAASAAAGLAFALKLAVVVALGAAAAPAKGSGISFEFFGIVATLAGVTAAKLALLPSLAVIAFAELTRTRSPWFYIAAAACAGALGWSALRLHRQLTGMIYEPLTSNPEAWTIFAVGVFIIPGAAAGFTYWLIAGRGAGGEPNPRASELQQKLPDG
jgi:hypothetical protein